MAGRADVRRRASRSAARGGRTERVLAALAEAGVPATFFVQGRWAEAYPALARSDRRRRPPRRATTPTTMRGCRCCPTPASATDVRGADGRSRGDRRRPAAVVPLSVRRGRGRPARSWPGSRRRATATSAGTSAASDWEPAATGAAIERGSSTGAIAHGDGAVVLLHPWPTCDARRRSAAIVARPARCRRDVRRRRRAGRVPRRGVSRPDGRTAVLAVDGGNSKTDVALVGRDGRLLAAVRGPTTSHQQVGLDAGAARLAGLVATPRRRAGLDAPAPAGDVGVVRARGRRHAGDVRRLRAAIAARRLAGATSSSTTPIAPLRAGSERGWGVGVICGAGVNAAGIAPDGGRARLAALGAISGDWGGGGDSGWPRLGAAVRARDGRGRGRARAARAGSLRPAPADRRDRRHRARSACRGPPGRAVAGRVRGAPRR